MMPQHTHEDAAVQLPTLFITSFHGLISRVLESGLLDELFRRPLRIVLFVPEAKRAYFEQTLAHYPNLLVEGISRRAVPRRTEALQSISLELLDTATMRLTRRSFRSAKSPLKRVFLDMLARGVGSFRLGRRLFRFLNTLLAVDHLFAPYFERYHPDLVFSTDVKHLLDAELIFSAKRRRVPAVAMVRSWDYLTGRGLTRVTPDALVVHNETIAAEAAAYTDMPRERLFISGLPHFDPYVNHPRNSREAFFKGIGADPAKRLLLYIPWGDKFADTDGEFLNFIADAVEGGELPHDIAVLVRLPPADSVAFAGYRPRPFVHLDVPGVAFGASRKGNEMSFADLLHLADTLAHCAVVVAPPSTLVIDAAAFDKPAVIMGFDGAKKKGYFEGVAHYFDFVHIRKLTATGAAPVVKNRAELIASVRKRLENPAFDAAGRERLRREQCHRLDGRSSKRLADFLFSRLPHP